MLDSEKEKSSYFFLGKNKLSFYRWYKKYIIRVDTMHNVDIIMSKFQIALLKHSQQCRYDGRCLYLKALLAHTVLNCYSCDSATNRI